MILINLVCDGPNLVVTAAEIYIFFNPGSTRIIYAYFNGEGGSVGGWAQRGGVAAQMG